jgi:hypothetical protein
MWQAWKKAENTQGFAWENLQTTNRLEYLVAIWRIILKWVSKK